MVGKLLVACLVGLGPVVLKKLIAEAQAGTLPDLLKPYSAEVAELATLLLSVVSPTPAPPATTP